MEFLKRVKRNCLDFFKPKPMKFAGMKIDPKWFVVDSYKERCPWKRIVRGTRSQADIKSRYPNSQCTSIAMTAAMFHEKKCINSWTKKDIDFILHQGNQNHRRFREKYIFSTNTDGRIALDDLPTTFLGNIKEDKFVARKTADFQGPVSERNPSADDELLVFCPSLLTVLKTHLKPNRPIICTIDEFSLLFIKVGSDIWLFDSHSRSSKGVYDELLFGKAFVAPFSSIGQLERYLLKEYEVESTYNACSLKIWIPDDYKKEHQNILQNLEKSLILKAAQKLIKMKNMDSHG